MAAGAWDAFMAYCDPVYQSPTIDVSSLLRVTTDIEFLSIAYVDDNLTVAFFDLNTFGNMAAERRVPAYPNATRRPRSRRIILTGNQAPPDDSLDIVMAPIVDRSNASLALTARLGAQRGYD